MTYRVAYGFVEVFDSALPLGREAPDTLADDTTGMRYAESDVTRPVLPKKGDLSLCNNWRGFRLLDVTSKIFSSILVRRMQIVMEEEGMEEQAGFQQLCGTIDGLFATAMGLQKRKGHNLETRALFIDLVKAFDSVPHEALFAVLRRFGLSDHFVNIVIRLQQARRSNL